MKSRLEDRRYFMKVMSVGTSIPAVIAFLWMFGGEGGLGFWLFLSLVAITSACVSAYLMWFVFKAVYGLDEPKTNGESRKQSGTD